MADRSTGDDSSNIEILECREPHLEATQDLELLAQEIAEAAVEDERKLSRTPSPSLTLPSSEECEATTREGSTEGESEEEEESEEEDEEEEEEEEEDGLDKCEDDLTHLDAETTTHVRSSSPVDEASWVLVDAADDEECKSEFPEHNFSVYRKFLARGDLRQKLSDLGFLRDAAPQTLADDTQQEASLQSLVMSCSESMVICDLPQEGDAEEDSPRQVFIKDTPEGPGWSGSISGATVTIEMERQGGLMVAAVTVWHRDLLSALNSLRSLVSSAGLVSYADVDVPSLLARAA